MSKNHNMMTFVDRYVSNDSTYIIEKMIEYHISKKYDDVRNIIIGYDSKHRKWISQYGKSLAEREIIKTDSIKTNSDINSFEKDKGMIFYDGEIFNNVRIQMDDVVKRILDAMFTVSEHVIEYKYITDIIVAEWNYRNTMPLYKNNIYYDIYGSLHFVTIDIKRNSWKEFKSIVRHEGLMIRDAFKLAVMSFLENRTNLLR